MSPLHAVPTVSHISFIVIKTTTYDVQQCVILKSVDSDKPVQSHYKHRSSK